LHEKKQTHPKYRPAQKRPSQNCRKLKASGVIEGRGPEGYDKVQCDPKSHGSPTAIKGLHPQQAAGNEMKKRGWFYAVNQTVKKDSVHSIKHACRQASKRHGANERWPAESAYRSR
jgi:hypothetical protein